MRALARDRLVAPLRRKTEIDFPGASDFPKPTLVPSGARGGGLGLEVQIDLQFFDGTMHSQMSSPDGL